MEIVRKYLTPDEISDPNQRWNETTDTYQYSPDGGTTWNDNPNADPRHSDIFRLPALTTGTARCDAAARIVAAWQETLEIFLASTSAAQFGTLMLELLLVLLGGTAFLGPVGLLIDLLIIIFYALVTIGSSTLAAAFTQAVWDGVLCIIFDNIDTDGQVSATQREAIMSQIQDAYPGTVYNVLDMIQGLFGEVLMSNAGVERSETGDCVACLGGCAIFLFDTVNAGYLDIVAGTLSESGGNYFVITTLHEGSQNVCRVSLDIPAGVTVTEVHIQWSDSSGVPRGTIMHNATVWDGSNHIATAYAPTLALDVTGLSLDSGYLGFQVNNNYNYTSNLIRLRIVYTATGSVPWVEGGTGCEA